MSLGVSTLTGGLGARLRLTSQAELHAVLRGAAQVLAIRLAGAGLAYASMILLARWLGAFQFGIYAYIWVWIVVLMPPLSLGYSSSALRFLPDYLARAKWRRLHGFLHQGYLVAFGVSTLIALLGAGLVYAFRAHVAPHYVMPLLIGLACLPVSVLFNQIEGVARAFGWVHSAFLPGYILRPILVMALVGGAYWAGTTPNAADALWALLSASVLTVLVQGGLVLSGTRKRMIEARPVYHSRHWATISLSFVMIDGFRMLLENSDMLMIGKLLDPDSVAVYFAAARTAGLIAFLYFAVVALAVPKISKIRVTGSHEELQRFVSGVTHLMFWPSLVAAGVLVGLGPFALSLFGGDFESGYWVLLVVLAGLVGRSALGPVEYLLNMTGHHADTLWASGLAALANIGLTLVLVPMMGIAGAAISSALALVGVSLWLALMVKRRLNISAFVFAGR
jgi:O-antigen/teichoic acid export membrane protein